MRRDRVSVSWGGGGAIALYRTECTVQLRHYAGDDNGVVRRRLCIYFLGVKLKNECGLMDGWMDG